MLNISASNFFAVSNVMDASSFATRFARRRIGKEMMLGNWKRALHFMCIGRRVINGERVDHGKSPWNMFRSLFHDDER